MRRFIPSDFILDLFSLPAGQIISSDWRRRFADLAESQRGEVEVVHVLNGSFLDTGVLFGFLRMIDPASGIAYLWGDGEPAVDYTTWADTARYTAAVAGDSLSVRGSNASAHWKTSTLASPNCKPVGPRTSCSSSR